MPETSGEKIDEMRDPSNFEFGMTPHGDKIHIVATDLPPSFLLLGGQASGRYGDDDEKALCGTVADYDYDVEPPEDVNGVIEHVCTRCNRHASKIRNKGKFAEVPL